MLMGVVGRTLVRPMPALSTTIHAQNLYAVDLIAGDPTFVTQVIM